MIALTSHDFCFFNSIKYISGNKYPVTGFARAFKDPLFYQFINIPFSSWIRQSKFLFNRAYRNERPGKKQIHNLE
ncbi:hypothetical protein ADN01_05560 [Levilinea saccharolytica]|uniref:Uncharacterized protein n=1 Tax=Levilinea saccharolytica TaxID=229921 RepID=A0A0N8GRI7_9CHLR|nr:hypothetical protein ADN01_05560 [Levilinea saccharolytica]